MQRLIITICMIGISMNLLGCQDKESWSEKQPVVPKNEYSYLDINNINYDKSSKIISYIIENKGNSTLFTGYPFTIEKYDEKSDWIETDLTNNLAFIEIAILIEPNSTYTDNIDLSKIDKLQDGYYRIVKEYSSDKEKIKVYIQLEVKDGELIDLQCYNKIG